MLKNEFLELTGLKEIDDEAFNEINGAYMELESTDKEEFCQMWMHDKNMLIYMLANESRKAKNRAAKLEGDYGDLAHTCISECLEAAEPIISNAKGIAYLIKLKVAYGTQLSDEEVKYVHQYLR